MMIQRAKKHIVNAMSVKKKQPDSTEVTQLSSLKIVASIFILIIVAAFGGYWMGQSSGPAETADVDKQVVLDKSVSFIKSLVASGVSVIGNNITESNGVYKISLTLTQGNQSVVYESYVTKDGELLFESGLEITETDTTDTTDTNDTTPVTTVTKSDKPVVEAFVMSHCPYGTQIEKGLLPVAELLDDKIDFQIKFVYYAMHGKTEVDEQLLQYCIMQTQPTKYLTYLSCFLEAGNTTDCLTRTGITNASLSKCISDTDTLYNITNMYNDQSTWLSGYYPQFNIYKADNDKYNVGGSPTLIVNGVEVSSARDPASLMQTICAAFNVQPAECSTTLSSETPAAGFGYTAGTATDASCG